MLPSAVHRGYHRTENDDALGDRLGLWHIGQPVKQNSFPFTGEAVTRLLAILTHPDYVDLPLDSRNGF